MKVTILACFLISVLTGAYNPDPVSAGRDYYDDYSSSPADGEQFSSSVQAGAGGIGCDERDSRERFIRTFLKRHCQDAEGFYELCRECVAVACLQYMALPTQVGRYQSCMQGHNRCCTKPGVSPRNVAGATSCYATGWISEVGFGQISVIRTLLGGQHGDAPRSFRGRLHGRKERQMDYD